MLHIKRRQFIQFSASTLATLGLSQLDIMQQGDKYAQVLAQNTKRKLALLVGINAYPDGFALQGCVNDVLLQQKLLTYRFGFNPKDILTLTDGQATRQGILTAFENHLIKQAQPGDIVVFHFSGHGSRIADPDRDSPDGLNSTFVAIDSVLPSGFPTSGGTVPDIMGHTLFLLMYALKTENVTVVLDSCHSGGGTRGNFRVRAREGGSQLQPSLAELEYQKQWLSRLQLSPQKFIELRRKGVAKGVVIASAQRDQYAVDASFSDFSAGAFTYELTKYLWQQTDDEPVSTAISRVGQTTKNVARERGTPQDPLLEVNLNRENTNAPIYFVRRNTPSGASQPIPAEAVITQVQGSNVELWLGGLDSQSLPAFTKNAIFTVVDAKGGEKGLVILQNRQGLIGTGRLLTGRQIQLKPGTLLQERIRSIPNALTLKVGIDSSLDRNTAQQVEQLIQEIKRIEARPLGTNEVQYIFGRMTKDRQQKFPKSPAPVGSYGLFLPSLDQIIPSSFGNSDESVNTAIKRLEPKLKSLLATRVVKQMLGNTNSSQVKVITKMTVAGSQEIIGQTFTIRGFDKVSPGTKPTAPSPAKFSNSGVRQLKVGTQIAFQVENNETRSLYITILVIDAQSEMTVIFPNNWSASEDAALIEANQKRVIPVAEDNFKLTIGEPFGFSEVLVIASATPLRNLLKALQQIAKSRGVISRAPVSVNDEFLDITNSLLEDLDTGTRGSSNSEGITLNNEVRGIDTKKLAAMALTFEVI
jgi:Caspase domain/Domain of unknown function (DUF4384)